MCLCRRRKTMPSPNVMWVMPQIDTPHPQDISHNLDPTWEKDHEPDTAIDNTHWSRDIPLHIWLQILHFVCSHDVETLSNCTACNPLWHGWHCGTCNRTVPHPWTLTHHFQNKEKRKAHYATSAFIGGYEAAPLCLCCKTPAKIWCLACTTAVYCSHECRIFDSLRHSRRERHRNMRLQSYLRACYGLPHPLETSIVRTLPRAKRRLKTYCSPACACCTSGQLSESFDFSGQWVRPGSYTLQIKCLTCEMLRKCSAVSRGWRSLQVVAAAWQCPQKDKESQFRYLTKLIEAQQPIDQMSRDLLCFIKSWRPQVRSLTIRQILDIFVFPYRGTWSHAGVYISGTPDKKVRHL